LSCSLCRRFPFRFCSGDNIVSVLVWRRLTITMSLTSSLIFVVPSFLMHTQGSNSSFLVWAWICCERHECWIFKRSCSERLTSCNPWSYLIKADYSSAASVVSVFMLLVAPPYLNLYLSWEWCPWTLLLTIHGVLFHSSEREMRYKECTFVHFTLRMI
jgi:hypothetical protein